MARDRKLEMKQDFVKSESPQVNRLGISHADIRTPSLPRWTQPHGIFSQSLELSRMSSDRTIIRTEQSPNPSISGSEWQTDPVTVIHLRVVIRGPRDLKFQTNLKTMNLKIIGHEFDAGRKAMASDSWGGLQPLGKDHRTILTCERHG